MRSIRGTLLRWLLPSFGVVCLLGGTMFFQAEKNSLEEQLKLRLREVAFVARGAVSPVGFRPPPGRPPKRREDSPSALILESFKDPSSGVYYQIWNADGETISRSASLADRDLGEPDLDRRAKNPWTYRLADGERVWAVFLALDRRRQVDGSGLVFAISCNEVDARLQGLAERLILGGVGSCLVLSIVVMFAIRRALKPVSELGIRASAVSANSLHERFDIERLPTEMKPIAERLNDLMERLERSFSRERKFSGDLAHELRTPLASMRVMAEVAAKWPDEKSVEDFEEIASVARNMQGTVDGLLMLARLEEGAGYPVENEPVDLAVLVKECFALHKELADERSITLDLQVLGEALFEGDEILLRAIVSNLVSNAILYGKESSSVSGRIAGEEAILAIANDAPNLSSEDIHSMFDRLWRQDKARANGSHSGLGLSIAQRCADAMGLQLEASLSSGERLDMRLRRIGKAD